MSVRFVNGAERFLKCFQLAKMCITRGLNVYDQQIASIVIGCELHGLQYTIPYYPVGDVFEPTSTTRAKIRDFSWDKGTTRPRVM
jgi:hypothetical protein